MATPAQSGTPPALDPAAQARHHLVHLVATYGLEMCADPWRCEALLRDLCGGGGREIFWLISALRQNLIADIRAAHGNTAEPILLARLSQKLVDELGLAAEPARWTAAVWIEAVRRAPASSTPVSPLPAPPPLPAWPAPGEALGEEWTALPRGIDRRWMSLCVASFVLSAAVLALIARVAFGAVSLAPHAWLLITTALAAGLTLGALCEWALARSLSRQGPRRRPAAGQAAWVLAPELLSLMAQPAVLVFG
ncbi:MAG: hypothetical protein ACRD1F_01875, partial [Terriglobales bacterium]